MALFIAVISAVVVVYQCGSVAGWSESTASRHYAGHNSNYLPPPHMTHHQFGKEKFLFAAPPPPPPSQYQFAGSNIGGTQTPQGSVSQRFSGHEQYAVPRASFNGDTQSGGRSFSDQNAAEDLASTQSKEYETQMLKMSVLFDDNQSYDERNLNDYGVNKNLV